MRVPMIAGNWKMNTTVKEAVELVNEMGPGLEEIGNVERVICPPFVSLSIIKDLIRGTGIKLGAQNLHFVDKGAYTGEVSPQMLAELCEFVIIGHSERRQYFHETDDIVNKKVKSALKVGLKPIVCVGEKLGENESGKTEEVVTTQLKLSLADLDNPTGLTVAYEPIWAIGTGKAATAGQANGTVGLIRSTLSSLFDAEFARNTLILYGGSVTADNASEFMQQSEIDGALVGGASLKADQFVSIVKQTSQIR